ncbi:hypothetical protein HNR46_000745 [Haloferula luteola]|uniref:Integral membrane protein n=1 Tax=Haloferula luteola TaxID=595692 RepID=A0A840UWI4_9BACT|nr:hypothetical protein [Haloferula luteola]MBB5350517.1 hypothetical protein [Haloferula luteola]
MSRLRGNASGRGKGCWIGLMVLTMAAVPSCAVPPSEPAEKVVFSDAGLGESSGLAVSSRDDRFLWQINDSGGTADLHLSETNGRFRGTVRLEGASNLDWEDLASFRWKGKSWLLVADVGDNASSRPYGVIYLAEEPVLPEDGELLQGHQPVFRKWLFEYPDGPRDCESVAVDAQEQAIYLLSKREAVPRLYRLSLESPVGEVPVKAEFVGECARIPVPPRMPFHPYGKQATGMDFSRDGRLAAVVSYQGVMLARRGENESWQSALSRPWEILGSHTLFQAEAIAFSAKGDRVWVTSEGVAAPLLSFPVPSSVPAKGSEH